MSQKTAEIRVRNFSSPVAELARHLFDPDQERFGGMGGSRLPAPPQRKVSVMHLIDTLDAGGAECVAVSMTNALVDSPYAPHLCTTRRDGPLADRLRPAVARLDLQRRRRLDLSAISRLVNYMRANDIRVLHAHSTSLFTAVLAAWHFPQARVIWHDHFGGLIDRRAILPYRLLARRVSAVIAVNERLAAWSRQRLRLPSERVCYIPNFAAIEENAAGASELPGCPGKRIVCVANIREQKDHVTLIRAMAQVVREEPQSHLLLVGSLVNSVCVDQLRAEIAKAGLTQHVSLLGVRQDVRGVLESCDIGVLSSLSEGLPVALLEYGAAALPAVSTCVGQCSEVLDGGNAGLLVPAGSPDALASALLTLLSSPPERSRLGNLLRDRVRNHYSPQAVMSRVMQLYGAVANVG
jgi:glycosyltransferase involved in cell wall biosynthesis